MCRDIRGAATSATAAALLCSSDYSSMCQGVQALDESAVLLRAVCVAMRTATSFPSSSSSSSKSLDVEVSMSGGSSIPSHSRDCSR